MRSGCNYVHTGPSNLVLSHALPQRLQTLFFKLPEDRNSLTFLSNQKA
jgi:hypothetical protein